jgi:hypothetical protein
VLKRGGGGRRKPADTSVPPVAKAPPLVEPDDPARAPEPGSESAEPPRPDLIARARVIAYDFTSQLPNFICDQLTTRSQSSSRKPNWKRQDRVEVELMYVDGREDYRNVRIDGKPLKKGTPEDTGQWSTGDFGTTLADVLSPSTNADFKKKGTDEVAGLPAVTYDFSVRQPNSHWVIQYGPPVKPAYTGTLWIHPDSARVLRIEMQARSLPVSHPLDAIEMTVEYGYVTIAGERYLMPVKSENLSCFRGTNNCSRNEIEFRNYRKFGVESNISATDSSVSFEGEAAPAPPAPAKPKP